jgi:hypothetical protein
MDSQGDTMPATSTISTQTRVLGGDSQEILFRPGQPGVIGVHSGPSPDVVHTETGLLEHPWASQRVIPQAHEAISRGCTTPADQQQSKPQTFLNKSTRVVPSLEPKAGV